MLEKNTRLALIGVALLLAISGMRAGAQAWGDSPRTVTYAGTLVTVR